MTPERLHEIERLFHEARERPPAERDAWLARACADDATLRREENAGSSEGNAPPSMIVVQNWFEELKAKVAAGK